MLLKNVLTYWHVPSLSIIAFKLCVNIRFYFINFIYFRGPNIAVRLESVVTKPQWDEPKIFTPQTWFISCLRAEDESTMKQKAIVCQCASSKRCTSDKLTVWSKFSQVSVISSMSLSCLSRTAFTSFKHV